MRYPAFPPAVISGRAVGSVLSVLPCSPFELYSRGAHIVVLRHCNLIKLSESPGAWLSPAFLKSLRNPVLFTQNLDGRGVLCSRASPEGTAQGGDVSPWRFAGFGKLRSGKECSSISPCRSLSEWSSGAAALVWTARTLLIPCAAASLPCSHSSNSPLCPDLPTRITADSGFFFPNCELRGFFFPLFFF